MKTEDVRNAGKLRIRFVSDIMIPEPSAANARTVIFAIL